jgi:hypothetical protein
MTSIEPRVVLFIGDSFATEQAAARLSESLARHAGDAGRHYRVERAGFPGAGLVHFLPEVRRRVDELEPDVVVHIYPDTDAVRHYSWLKRLLFPTLDGAARGWWWCYLCSERLKAVHWTLGDAVWRMFSATILRENDIRDGFEKDRALLDDFAQQLGRRGIRYILCQWDIAFWGLTDRFHRTFEPLNRYPHVRCLSGLNDYLSIFHEAEYKIPNDGHPNDLGNRLMADYIVQKGMEAGLL